MIENYSDRLASAMAHAGLSISRMANMLGVSYQAIKKVLDGKTRSLTAENNTRAAGICGVSAAWLATGEGSMLESHQIGAIPPAIKSIPHSLKGDILVHGIGWENSNVESAQAPTIIRRIPVRGEIKAGQEGVLDEHLYPESAQIGYVEYWRNDLGAYALRVRGDSMHPRYRAGEFVVVTPGVEPEPGADVVVELTDGRKLLKQLNWIRDDEIQLLSINQGYEPLTISKSDVLSIRLVAGGVGRHAFVTG